ncbi:hypothetical protein EV426DRAFT_703475 [Tirmania nivea]|nr:hypothetical protein EV426DRAFT_703475 [Tirmania nivea]
MPRPLQHKPQNLQDLVSGKKNSPISRLLSDQKDRRVQVTQPGSKATPRTQAVANSSSLFLLPSPKTCTAELELGQNQNSQTSRPTLWATVSQNAPHPTMSRPQYTLHKPLPIHLFGSHHNPNTTPYLIHLTYSTSTAQDSAFARLSAFSESRDYAGQYLGLKEIRDKGLKICKGYEGHNMAVENIARWLEKVWVVEMVGACRPKGRAGKWWVEFCTLEEVQLIEILEEVGVLVLGLTNEAEEAEEAEETWGYPHRRLEPTFHVSQPSGHLQHLYLQGVANKAEQPIHWCSTLSASFIKHSPSPYIISQLRSNKDYSMNQTTAHELAHFAYHSSPHYRALVDSLYKEMSDTTRTYIESVLVEGVGYASEVCVDEWQAYLVAEGEAYLLPDKKTRCPLVVGRAASKKEYSAAHLREVREELERARASLRAEWKRENSKAVKK